MKKKGIIISLIFLVGILVLTQTFIKAQFNKESVLCHIIRQGLTNWHYKGIKIDDSFSKIGFHDYLNILDRNKRFFLKSDMEKLNIFQYKLDDQLKTCSLKFMKEATLIIRKRIGEVKGFYMKLLSNPFNFTRDESFSFALDKRDFCANQIELEEYWRKLLKYQTLMRYINLLNGNKKNKPDQKLEEKARESVLKSYAAILDRLDQTTQKDALDIYLNALIQVFDPHTSFFPPKNKQDFDIEMTGSFEGIGALLGQKDGCVKIERIIPGGPCWNQKKLEPGDLVLKVAQEGKEPVDIVGIRTVDAVKLIRGKKGTKVRLTVKKPNGQIKVEEIIRGIVIVEESFARSAVYLDKNLNKKLGYIFLPRFYRDFEKIDGRSSTRDVKKEIEKLNTKQVEGIILDLRSNGGGSLIDAVGISGLFIKEGPIVQIKRKGIKPGILKDTNPQIAFEKPLVILINSLSASAAEIMAGALQDYERAIIVGGKSTFGKGTVQRMINLDDYLNKNLKNISPLGALKITVQKFYRITGSSNQYKGIIPDVVLPDRYDYFEIGEKHLDHSMQWDEISSVDFKKGNSFNFNKAILAEKSAERIKTDRDFKEIQKSINRLQEINKKNKYSLNLKTVLKEQEELKNIQNLSRDKKGDLSHIEITASGEFEKMSERLAKINREKQKSWFSLIKKDIYVREAANILIDWIEESNKNINRK